MIVKKHWTWLEFSFMLFAFAGLHTGLSVMQSDIQCHDNSETDRNVT